MGSGAGILADKFVLLHRATALGVDEESLAYSWLDDTLSALLHTLEWTGLAEDTLFIATTDHGSRQKASLYLLDGTSIPFLARWPRRTGAHYHMYGVHRVRNCVREREVLYVLKCVSGGPRVSFARVACRADVRCDVGVLRGRTGGRCC
jgi:hypothetical protein